MKSNTRKVMMDLVGKGVLTMQQAELALDDAKPKSRAKPPRQQGPGPGPGGTSGRALCHRCKEPAAAAIQTINWDRPRNVCAKCHQYFLNNHIWWMTPPGDHPTKHLVHVENRSTLCGRPIGNERWIARERPRPEEKQVCSKCWQKEER